MPDKLYHAHPGGAKGCIQPPMGNWTCPYTSKAEADAHRHLSMLDQTIVNVAVQCLNCDGILKGHAYWPLRKSMALHRTNGRCHNASFDWVPMVLADAFSEA